MGKKPILRSKRAKQRRRQLLRKVDVVSTSSSDESVKVPRKLLKPNTSSNESSGESGSDIFDGACVLLSEPTSNEEHDHSLEHGNEEPLACHSNAESSERRIDSAIDVGSSFRSSLLCDSKLNNESSIPPGLIQEDQKSFFSGKCFQDEQFTPKFLTLSSNCFVYKEMTFQSTLGLC